MTEQFRRLTSRSPEDTARLGRRLADALEPGDCILLEGPVGAGKTHFARSLIQSLQMTAEDVPSPTYTLVQIYDGRPGEIWHADLYRLTSPEEIVELGLEEAFSSAICLVEWPEALGALSPPDALTLRFRPDPDDPDAREIELKWDALKWAEKIGETTDAG